MIGSRYNHELCQLYNESDIITFIKINRLRWLGNVQWMNEDGVPLKMLHGHRDGAKRTGKSGDRGKVAVESLPCPVK